MVYFGMNGERMRSWVVEGTATKINHAAEKRRKRAYQDKGREGGSSEDQPQPLDHHFREYLQELGVIFESEAAIITQGSWLTDVEVAENNVTNAVYGFCGIIGVMIPNRCLYMETNQ